MPSRIFPVWPMITAPSAYSPASRPALALGDSPPAPFAAVPPGPSASAGALTPPGPSGSVTAPLPFVPPPGPSGSVVVAVLPAFCPPGPSASAGCGSAGFRSGPDFVGFPSASWAWPGGPFRTDSVGRSSCGSMLALRVCSSRSRESTRSSRIFRACCFEAGSPWASRSLIFCCVSAMSLRACAVDCSEAVSAIFFAAFCVLSTFSGVTSEGLARPSLMRSIRSLNCWTDSVDPLWSSMSLIWSSDSVWVSMIFFVDFAIRCCMSGSFITWSVGAS